MSSLRYKLRVEHISWASLLQACLRCVQHCTIALLLRLQQVPQLGVFIALPSYVQEELSVFACLLGSYVAIMTLPLCNHASCGACDLLRGTCPVELMLVVNIPPIPAKYVL